VNPDPDYFRKLNMNPDLDWSPKRVCRPVVADSHPFDEKSDPDPH